MQLLINVFIPITLMLMMVVVGMGLTRYDFQRAHQFPRIILASIAGQVILLPVAGGIVIWFFDPPEMIIAGIILVVACPGGAISNYYSYMARANVALSVTLTAVSTMVGIITLPVIAKTCFWLLLGSDGEIDVPIALITGQLFILLLLPIVMGMWVRHRWPRWTIKKARQLRLLSILALTSIILFISWKQVDDLVFYFNTLILSASAYTLLTMAAGWVVGSVMNVKSPDLFALVLEFSIRNLAIVAVVGVTLLNNAALVVFAAVFFLIQVPLLLFAVYFYHKKNHAKNVLI